MQSSTLRYKSIPLLTCSAPHLDSLSWAIVLNKRYRNCPASGKFLISKKKSLETRRQADIIEFISSHPDHNAV